MAGWLLARAAGAGSAAAVPESGSGMAAATPFRFLGSLLPCLPPQQTKKDTLSSIGVLNRNSIENSGRYRYLPELAIGVVDP